MNAAEIAALVLFYPAMVLWIALTGPHNETERREQAQRKWEPTDER